MPGLHRNHSTVPSNYSYPPTPGASYLSIPSPSVPTQSTYGAVYIPLPPCNHSIHWCLREVSHPQFTFDLSRPYENVLLDRRFPREHLYAPATEPPTPWIVIDRVAGMKNWQIHVRPSTTEYVTVVDVFRCIYEQLRINASQAEYEACSDPTSVSLAFQARVNSLPPHMQVQERNKGLKRIDFLGTRNFFSGLRQTLKGRSDTWVLCTL